MTGRRGSVSALIAGLAILLAGCFNPFSPVEGTIGSGGWSDQTTVGGLLHNFAQSYDYRDSLRYADCLSESFVFHYFDVEAGRFDSWFRHTDLQSTGGLFRIYDRIDLEWNSIPVGVEGFNLPDSVASFIVRYNLTLGQEAPLMGYAHFEAKREEDGKFRVLTWWDDF